MENTDNNIFGTEVKAKPAESSKKLSKTELFMTRIDAATLYINVEEREEYSIIDDNGKRFSYDLESSMMKKKHKDLLNQLIENQSEECEFRYVGYNQNQIIERDNDLSIFNTYWSSAKHYGTEPEPMPEIYKLFFANLLPNDECREYVLDWMASSLKRRLNTYLVLIGEEGIGKGTLTDILTNLHLPINTSKMNDHSIKSNFNGHLSKTTLIVADEIKIENDAAMNVLKLFANDKLEYENKGQNRFTGGNYNNIIITTNHENAIQFNEGSRRFSIPKLTTNPMIDWPSVSNITSFNDDLKYENNIKQLFRYLWNRPITNNMEKCYFNKERFDEIMISKMNDWQACAVEFVKAKKSATTKEILAKINSTNPKFVPSERRIFDFFKITFKKQFKSTFNGEKNIKRIDYIGPSKTESADPFKVVL